MSNKTIALLALAIAAITMAIAYLDYKRKTLANFMPVAK